MGEQLLGDTILSAPPSPFCGPNLASLIAASQRHISSPSRHGQDPPWTICHTFSCPKKTLIVWLLGARVRTCWGSPQPRRFLRHLLHTLQGLFLVPPFLGQNHPAWNHLSALPRHPLEMQTRGLFTGDLG